MHPPTNPLSSPAAADVSVSCRSRVVLRDQGTGGTYVTGSWREGGAPGGALLANPVALLRAPGQRLPACEPRGCLEHATRGYLAGGTASFLLGGQIKNMTTASTAIAVWSE